MFFFMKNQNEEEKEQLLSLKKRDADVIICFIIINPVFHESHRVRGVARRDWHFREDQRVR